MAADTGAIVGPILAGVLIDRGSYALAFAVTRLVTLAAASRGCGSGKRSAP